MGCLFLDAANACYPAPKKQLDITAFLAGGATPLIRVVLVLRRCSGPLLGCFSEEIFYVKALVSWLLPTCPTGRRGASLPERNPLGGSRLEKAEAHFQTGALHSCNCSLPQKYRCQLAGNLFCPQIPAQPEIAQKHVIQIYPQTSTSHGIAHSAFSVCTNKWGAIMKKYSTKIAAQLMVRPQVAHGLSRHQSPDLARTKVVSVSTSPISPPLPNSAPWFGASTTNTARWSRTSAQP